jgi:hypothetical protein
VKCDQPLNVEGGGTFTSAEIVTNVDYNGRKTMSENLVFSGGEESHSPDSKSKRRLCVNCNHPVFSDYYFCPGCGVSLTDEASVAEAIASKTTIRDAASKTTLPDAASKTTVPGDLSKVTIRDAASKTTLPDAASKTTVPGDLSKVTIRDAASKTTLPDAASKTTVPGDLSKATIRDAASKTTLPDAASKTTVPGDLSKATIRDAALITISDIASKLTPPGAATESAVPDVTIPDTVALEDNIIHRTVRPGKRSYCTLTLIPDEKEPVTATLLSFSDKKIILNRANTEPGNITITSKEQALLSCENKRWFIEDRSELKTTYLYVSEKTELKSGDIIVLGDRRFLFDG